MEKKILLVGFVLALLFLVACAPKEEVPEEVPVEEAKEPAPPVVLQETTEDLISDVGSDLNELETLEEELDISDLESLDQELADLETVDLG